MPSLDSKYHFYVIHQRPFQDKKIILTLFVRGLGKVQVVHQIYSVKKSLQLQPMREYCGVLKQGKGMYKLSQVEQVSFTHPPDYLCQLSVLYLNELIYWLLPEDMDSLLYDYYGHFLSTLERQTLSLQLRHFEVRMLEALGYSILSRVDGNDQPINADTYYLYVPQKAFVKVSPCDHAYSGALIVKMSQGVEHWCGDTLKMIKAITRLQIDACLEGRVLHSRQLLLDYLALRG